MPFIAYFMPSLEEARDLAGRTDAEDCARFFLDRGVPHVVPRMGGEGSLIATRDAFIQIPALPLHVVDTTGCGDADDAGFICALNQASDLETCGRFATAAASLVATGLGSDAGIESFEQTLEAMRRGQVRSSLV